VSPTRYDAPTELIEFGDVVAINMSLLWSCVNVTQALPAV
jgi:hypothetical protein